jgi:hypothetical protein
MSMDTPTPPPIWAFAWLQWGFTTALGLLAGTWYWLYRRLSGKVDIIAKDQATFATTIRMNGLEIRVAELASRKELAAYMAQVYDDMREREDRMREDRRAMHKDNLDRFGEVRADLAEIRKDTSQDFGSVHQRIDKILQK